MTNELFDILHEGDLKKTKAVLETEPILINAVVADGYAPIHIAAMFGRENILDYLIDHQALVNQTAKNPSGVTALHLATAYRDEATAKRMIERLVSHGAELNAKQSAGETALHQAVARGSVVLTDCLILAGADPFLKDNLARTAMDLAMNQEMYGQRETLQLTLKGAYSLPLK